jgi:hypothetical protein
MPAARWDVVPFQDITTQTEIGVVAFHKDLIDRVEFYVDDVLYDTVTAVTKNSITNVWEYNTIIDPNDYGSSQEIEITAKVYPVTGNPRFLNDFYGNTGTKKDHGQNTLRLWINKGDLPANAVYMSPTGSDSNSGTEASPFLTFAKAFSTLGGSSTISGGTVYLLPGDYTPDGGPFVNPDRWVTIRPAPGVLRSQVRILSVGTVVRWSLGKLKFKNVTLYAYEAPRGTTIVAAGKPNNLLWCEDVVLQGSNRKDKLEPFYNLEVFWNDSEIYDIINGTYVTGGVVTLIRDTHIAHVLEDVYRGARMILNNTVDDHDRLDTYVHPDLYQVAPNAEPDNIIIYGIVTTNSKSQFIQIRGKNWAVINQVFDCLLGGQFWQYGSATMQHIIVEGVTIRGQSLLFRPPLVNTWEYLIFNNNSFANVTYTISGTTAPLLSFLPNLYFYNNHFVSGTTWGTRFTTGDAQYQDPGAQNFKPGPSSPLNCRVGFPNVPVDANGDIVPICGSIGALQP